MMLGEFRLLEWLALFEHELLLFAGVFFLVGALDELAIDIFWAYSRIRRLAKTGTIERAVFREWELAGKAAVLIPAWHEAEVIGTTIGYMLKAWPQARIRLYVGCYRNDPETLAAAVRAADGDPRLRLVVHDRRGPSTKADCLNRLYAGLGEDERRSGEDYFMVVLHDAEDMVDPAGIKVLEAGLAEAEFAQLPVVPEPQRESRWIAGHYCDEFAEAHGKAMVVRDVLGAALPAAGVGCAFSRFALGRLAYARRREGGPFSVECLTEDYELGLRIKAMGGRARFLRLRGEDGRLVATRACFPARLDLAVRQKTRWIHGIALQSWDRLGWSARPVELWMRMRDRRGPLTAIVLAAAYLLLVIAGLLWVANLAGLGRPWELDPLVELLLIANFASFLWRALLRFAFTTREYGWAEGLRAVVRIPLANIVAIMAGRRALFAYVKTLGGALPEWDKTPHHAHPAAMRQDAAA